MWTRTCILHICATCFSQFSFQRHSNGNNNNNNNNKAKQAKKFLVCLSTVCVCVLCVSMNGKGTPLKNDDFDAFCVGFSTRTNADDTIPILNYIKVLYKLRFSYIQHQLEFRYVSDKSWLRLARVIIFLYILLCKEKEEDKKKNIYPYTDKNKILQEKKYLNIHGKKY